MDKYDEAIEYYRANPDRIRFEWANPPRNSLLMGTGKYPHACLFNELPTHSDPYDGGCPTQCHPRFDGRLNYRSEVHQEVIRKLDELIAAGHIPSDFRDITIDHLPYYAEIQRFADRYRDSVKG